MKPTLIAGLLLTAWTGAALADCTNDMQCKGDRVCVQGQCVSLGDANGLGGAASDAAEVAASRKALAEAASKIGSHGSKGKEKDRDALPIFIVSSSGEVRLKGENGSPQAESRMGLQSQSILLEGEKSSVRIADRNPHWRIEAPYDPQLILFLTPVEPNPKMYGRKIKISSSYSMKAVKQMFHVTSQSVQAPQDALPCDFKKLSEGNWEMDPKKALKPGEYAIYVVNDYAHGVQAIQNKVFSFAIE